MDAGSVMRVQVTNTDSRDSQLFLAKMQQGGRITVPKITAELLGLKFKQLVNVVIWLPPENTPSN